MGKVHVFTHDGRTVSVVLPDAPDGYTIVWEGTDNYETWEPVERHSGVVKDPRDVAQFLTSVNVVVNLRLVSCTPAPIEVPRGTLLSEYEAGCPVCVYGEPSAHTCDQGQQHRYGVANGR